MINKESKEPKIITLYEEDDKSENRDDPHNLFS